MKRCVQCEGVLIFHAWMNCKRRSWGDHVEDGKKKAGPEFNLGVKKKWHQLSTNRLCFRQLSPLQCVHVERKRTPTLNAVHHRAIPSCDWIAMVTVDGLDCRLNARHTPPPLTLFSPPRCADWPGSNCWMHPKEEGVPVGRQIMNALYRVAEWDRRTERSYRVLSLT